MLWVIEIYNIAVIGGSEIDEKYCQIAYDVGKILAERNVTVFCGGLTGVMECAAKGVSENGGVTVGILPGTSVEQGNKYLSVRVPTGLGYARNFFIIRAAEAVIAIDGASGTLSEASFAITEGKSVVAIGNMKIDHRKDREGYFYNVETPEEAVSKALEEAEKFRIFQRRYFSYWDEFR